MGGGGGGGGGSGGRCWFTTPSWGHGGLDWGSGFPMAGWVPALNFSFTLGSTTGEGFPSGMNTTMPRAVNDDAYGTAFCRLMNATVHAMLPGYPSFVGYDIGGAAATGSCFLDTGASD